MITLSFDEFNKEVSFQYGIPLLVLNIMENLTGIPFISKVKNELFKTNTQIPNVIEHYDEEFVLLKQPIPDEFYENHLFRIFNLLG